MIYMPPAKNGSIEIDFVCKNCSNGRHGCAGVWTGLGLKISCSCSCVKRVAKRKRLIARRSTQMEAIEPE
jgi:hypothetical protein